MATSLVTDMDDPEFRKLLAQEELILEVTEVLCGLLEEETISRKELADRLGKTKGFVSQLLNGGRNLTLRTLADILHVLGYRASLTPFKEGEQRHNRNIIEFPTTYQMPKSPIYINDSKLKDYSKPDHYHNIKKAISV